MTIKDLIPPLLIKMHARLTENPMMRQNRLDRHEFISSFWKSYGGKGLEDLFMELLFDFREKGTYVEIGTNDPTASVSYTQKFYNRGWRGISVEPCIKEFEALKKSRPEDINLNICIGDKNGQRSFYEPRDSQAASLMPHLASRWGKVKVRTVNVSTLETMLNEFLESEIDFMVIDAEGMELEILKSNDWRKYKPKALIIETVHHHYKEIVDYLKLYGYMIVYINHLNSIFVEKKAFANDERFDVSETKIAKQK